MYDLRYCIFILGIAAVGWLPWILISAQTLISLVAQRADCWISILISIGIFTKFIKTANQSDVDEQSC